MIQGKDDSTTNTVSYNGIDVLRILLPFWFFLVESDSIIDFFQQLVNSCSTIFDSLKFVGNSCFEDVVIFFRRNWFLLSINHWLFEFSKFIVDVVKRPFHLINNFIKVINCFLRLFDKTIDPWRLPLEFFNSWFYVFVHSHNSLLH